MIEDTVKSRFFTYTVYRKHTIGLNFNPAPNLSMSDILELIKDLEDVHFEMENASQRD